MAIAAKRKIFTKYLAGAVNAPALAATVYDDNDFWVPQEDIEIVGSLLEISILTSENDGQAVCHAELSQVAVAGQEGTFNQCQATCGWNTVPAWGRNDAEASVVMFPSDKVITVREEGRISLNFTAFCALVTAGTTGICVHAVIYYTKK